MCKYTNVQISKLGVNAKWQQTVSLILSKKIEKIKIEVRNRQHDWQTETMTSISSLREICCFIHKNHCHSERSEEPD